MKNKLETLKSSLFKDEKGCNFLEINGGRVIKTTICTMINDTSGGSYDVHKEITISVPDKKP